MPCLGVRIRPQVGIGCNGNVLAIKIYAKINIESNLCILEKLGLKSLACFVRQFIGHITFEFRLFILKIDIMLAVWPKIMFIFPSFKRQNDKSILSILRNLNF